MASIDPWTGTLEQWLFQFYGSPAPPRERHPIELPPEFMQWVEAQEVLRLRKAVESGDGLAVMRCVFHCARGGLVMPEWLACEFSERYRTVVGAEVAGWDDAFGRPHPKGAQLPRLRFRMHARPDVCHAVMAAIEDDPTRPIDKGLFEEIGLKLGTGATLTEEIYRERPGYARMVLDRKRELLANPQIRKKLRV